MHFASLASTLLKEEESARDNPGSPTNIADFVRSGQWELAVRQVLDAPGCHHRHQDVKYDFTADLARIGDRSIHEIIM